MSRLQNERIEPGRRVAMMDKVNPIYIPRNHRVEEALSIAVEEGDLTEFKNLLSIVSEPFNEIAGREKYAGPAENERSVPYFVAPSCFRVSISRWSTRRRNNFSAK